MKKKVTITKQDLLKHLDLIRSKQWGIIWDFLRENFCEDCLFVKATGTSLTKGELLAYDLLEFVSYDSESLYILYGYDFCIDSLQDDLVTEFNFSESDLHDFIKEVSSKFLPKLRRRSIPKTQKLLSSLSRKLI